MGSLMKGCWRLWRLLGMLGSVGALGAFGLMSVHAGQYVLGGHAALQTTLGALQQVTGVLLAPTAVVSSVGLFYGAVTLGLVLSRRLRRRAARLAWSIAVGPLLNF